MYEVGLPRKPLHSAQRRANNVSFGGGVKRDKRSAAGETSQSGINVLTMRSGCAPDIPSVKGTAHQNYVT